MVSDFDLCQPGEMTARRPDTIRAADGDGKDRHIGLQRQPRGASLELNHRAIGLPAPTLRKDYYRATITQPLQSATDCGGVAAFDLQRPGAEKLD